MNATLPLVTVPPGEWYLGQEIVLNTLLGSCVAITAWHPFIRCGGLCHYLLPRIPATSSQFKPDARYGVIGLQFLQSALIAIAPLREFQFGCFGGSVMFKGNEKIGEANVQLAREWLQKHHIAIYQSDVGGPFGRKISMNTDTGKISIALLD